MTAAGTYRIAGCRRTTKPRPPRAEEATWIHGVLRVAVQAQFAPETRDACHVRVTLDGAQLAALSGERFAPAHGHRIERWIGCDCYRYLVVQLEGEPPYRVDPDTGHLVADAVLITVTKGPRSW